jgi:RNA-binding protein
MIEISPVERRALRAAAHHLKPVVSISQKGLTATVMAEIDRSLKAHELIKLRLYGIEREDREALSSEICGTLDCVDVQHIGNLLVLWRPAPEPVAGQESAPTPRRQAKPANKKQAAARNESRNRKA